jgi:hypothetical protein
LLSSQATVHYSHGWQESTCFFSRFRFSEQSNLSKKYIGTADESTVHSFGETYFREEKYDDGLLVAPSEL